MAWAPLLLMLLSHGTGSLSQQPEVTQLPSLSASLGATARLTCTLSRAVTDGHYPHWIQQKPGQAPTTLIYNTNNRHSWTPARFSGSIQGGKAALTLSGAQPEDEAMYYCTCFTATVRTVTGAGGEVGQKHKAQCSPCFWGPLCCSRGCVPLGWL
ncbi:Ig lambda chain V region 4A [Myotis davidii]|uniref:Ig lambda chain V region 4A n=1 Tax=Myotis davidii TaxID=225400 RepID=L5MLR7_MYODS|nr:Ig lambda chain V region 4A [Myotis davidii]